MAWVAVAGAGVSLAGKAFSAYKGGQANKANQKILDSQLAENQAEYDNEGKKSFLETNAAKDITKQMNEGLEDSQKANASRAAITGASDEAKVAANTGANKTFVDGISRLAANATQYQNQQKAIYRQGKSALLNAQMGINNQKAQSAANLGDNAGDLASTVATGLGTGGDNLSSSTFDDTYGKVIKAPKGEKFVN